MYTGETPCTFLKKGYNKMNAVQAFEFAFEESKQIYYTGLLKNLASQCNNLVDGIPAPIEGIEAFEQRRENFYKCYRKLLSYWEGNKELLLKYRLCNVETDEAITLIENTLY